MYILIFVYSESKKHLDCLPGTVDKCSDYLCHLISQMVLRPKQKYSHQKCRKPFSASTMTMLPRQKATKCIMTESRIDVCLFVFVCRRCYMRDAVGCVVWVVLLGVIWVV
jgi:hypothetical protein